MSKIQLESFVQYGRLFEVYGKLLSEDRQKIMTDYFGYNMTLAEIAEEREISRQAVLDAIDKSCEKLKGFENALKVVEKKQKLVYEIEELLSLTKDEKIIKKVEKILKDL